MTTSLRPQRLLQRVPSPATYHSSAATRRTFLSKHQSAPHACMRSYNSQTTTPSRSLRSYPKQPLQARSFTCTPSARADHANEANATVTNAPDITNDYTIFPTTLPGGPPPGSPFAINIADLRREFLQLQGITHPDKYPAGPAKQRAEALSARINEAYRTLVDPLLRAQYLLREMHGIDVTAEDGASKHALDPETLMEVMEVQETIEEVGADPAAEGTIAQLKKENDVRVEDCVKALGEAFDRGDLETARQECVRLRFWYSVGEGLREWEPGHTEIRLVH